MALHYKEDNAIGFLEFDHDDSKVNLLNADVLKQLAAVLGDIKSKPIKALVIQSAKPDVFIAGADIKEIEKIVEPKDGASKAKAGQDVMNMIEDLPMPTIAVIDGVTLGGGCELALACDYRVATFNPKIKIGLPEVNLGFVPGFGGTYRLPRLIGLSEGMKMILSGQPVDSTKALKIGLVDRLFSQVGLKNSVDEFVRSVMSGEIKLKKYGRAKKKGMAKFIDESLLGNWMVFRASKKSVLKATKGNYPAPLKAIKVMKANFYCNRSKGLDIECRAFGELAVTEISKNCVKVFYMSEKYRKLSLPDAAGIKPRPIKKAAVLGAGVMGGGIAQLLSSRDIWARLKDINHDALAKGYQAAAKIYGQAVQKRKLTSAQAAVKMDHITSTLNYSGFKHVDIVVEAVVEKMEVKQKVFKELSAECAPGTILATNTSALSLKEMARDVEDKSRVIGIHFFNPVHRMPLIEIITMAETSKETIVSTLKLVQQLGKTPIVVKDSPGFIVNRILLVYMSEAGRLLDESGALEALDNVMVDFGMPMGPFLLSDEVGMDVGLKVMHILEDAFGDRFKSVPVFEKVLELGLLGKKTGKGFYVHDKNRTLNDTVVRMLTKCNSRGFHPEESLQRMLFLMVNEAAMCLEEGVVDEPDAIDVGMIFGTGFPPFRGGLLHYADSIGVAKIVDRLEYFQKELKSDRYKPCAYLVKLKNENKGFYH